MSGPLYGCMFVLEERQQPIPYDTSAAGICTCKMEELLSGSSLLMLHEKGAVLSWPAEKGRGKAFYTQQLCVPCPWQGEGRAEAATEQRGRGGQRWKILSITHLAAPPAPFNPLWKSYQVFSISFESVKTNMRV